MKFNPEDANLSVSPSAPSAADDPATPMIDEGYPGFPAGMNQATVLAEMALGVNHSWWYGMGNMPLRKTAGGLSLDQTFDGMGFLFQPGTVTPIDVDGVPGQDYGCYDPTEAPKYFGADMPDNDWSTTSGNFGPHCRNCHRGSSDCACCHEASADARFGRGKATSDAQAVLNVEAGGTTKSVYNDGPTGTLLDPYANGSASVTASSLPSWRNERTVYWEANWRTNPGTTTDSTPSYASPGIDTACCNDGFSWPHRTMGFKLLKDELWGLDFDGSEVWVGESRNGFACTLTISGNIATGVTTNATPTVATNNPELENDDAYAKLMQPAQDLDSACLDCHNPDVWNVHDRGDSNDLFNRNDIPGDPDDNMNDELLLRGLP